ncbi:MAG: hypothetical protein DMF01_01765 [Verrucomicrobia bacterium]|nr:MAG: hypothetical protein DMF01_01765 [Verrucomicrobiota bacterium]
MALLGRSAADLRTQAVTKSGGAPPHAKTQAQKCARDHGHVLECGSVLPLWAAPREVTNRQ